MGAAQDPRKSTEVRVRWTERSGNNNDRSAICRAWSKASIYARKNRKSNQSWNGQLAGNWREIRWRPEDVHFFLFRNLGRDLEQRGTGKSNRKPYLCGIHIRR